LLAPTYVSKQVNS